jgi:hypothetical protein
VACSTRPDIDFGRTCRWTLPTVRKKTKGIWRKNETKGVEGRDELIDPLFAWSSPTVAGSFGHVRNRQSNGRPRRVYWMIVVGRGHRHYHRWSAAHGGGGLFAQAHLPTLLREAQGGSVAWMAGLLVVRLELPEGGAVHCSVVSDRLCDVDPTQVPPAERALQEAVAEGLSLAVNKAGNYVGVNLCKKACT